MSAEEELLSRAYLAYNGQDVDGLLRNRIRPIFGEYYGDPENEDSRRRRCQPAEGASLTAALIWVVVRTLSCVRSARNRSTEYSTGSPVWS